MKYLPTSYYNHRGIYNFSLVYARTAKLRIFFLVGEHIIIYHLVAKYPYRERKSLFKFIQATISMETKQDKRFSARKIC